VELLAAEKAEALVEFHRGSVGDLGFEDDLNGTDARLAGESSPCWD